MSVLTPSLPKKLRITEVLLAFAHYYYTTRPFLLGGLSSGGNLMQHCVEKRASNEEDGGGGAFHQFRNEAMAKLPPSSLWDTVRLTPLKVDIAAPQTNRGRGGGGGGGKEGRNATTAAQYVQTAFQSFVLLPFFVHLLALSLPRARRRSLEEEKWKCTNDTEISANLAERERGRRMALLLSIIVRIAGLMVQFSAFVMFSIKLAAGKRALNS